MTTNQYNAEVSRQYNSESRRVRDSDPARRLIKEHLVPFDRACALADVGCGGGIDLEFYYDMGFPNIVGVEPSPDQRELASILLASKATILEGAFDWIPLDDSSLDIVVSRFSLMYCLNTEKAFAEASRVLKPNGTFIAVVSHPYRDNKLPRNADGTVTVKFFHGKMEATIPYHSLEEYCGDGFKRFFVPFKPRPYSDADVMGYTNKELLNLRPDEPTTLFFGGQNAKTLAGPACTHH